MGTLTWTNTGRVIPLAPTTTVGRAEEAWLHLEDEHVSHHHATLSFRGGRWWLRDLGSSNGTLVDGKRLSVGEDRPLDSGANVVFGTEACAFDLSASDPPGAAAKAGDGTYAIATDGLLVLPAKEGGAGATLFMDAGALAWMVEDGEGRRTPLEGPQLKVEGRVWTVELPYAVDETPLLQRGLHLASAQLQVACPRDPEAKVQVTLRSDRAPVSFELGWPGRLLAVLAEARLEDRAQSASERGWRPTKALAERLGTSPKSLNVATQRLRAAFAGAGLEEAMNLVEVRPKARRLGTDRVELRYT